MKWVAPLLSVMLAGSIAFAQPNGAWKIFGTSEKASYQFEEGNATCTDFTGNGNTMTISNAPSVVVGKIGNTVQFNGTTQHGLITSSVSFSNAQPSVSFWINTTNSASYIISKEKAGAGDMEIIQAIGGNSYFGFFSGGSWRELVGNIGLTASTWHHVVYTYDGTTFKSYRNGVFQQQSNYTGSFPYDATQNINVGRRYDNTYYLSGRIDDLRFFSRALTQGEVSALYNLGR